MSRSTNCAHIGVTISETGGVCNSCGALMDFDTTSRRWIPAIHFDPAEDGFNSLDFVQFKVVSKSYDQIRAIMAETGQSDTALLIALKEGYGLMINPTENPTLYFVVTDQQLKDLAEMGVKSPTWFQLIGTATAWGLSAESSKEKFTKMAKETL